MPMISGSTPANAKLTSFILGARPNSFAASALARMLTVAPSLSRDELPAVTRPCGRNGVLRSARPSIVVSGRSASSSVARPQPVSLLVATGMRSGWILPAVVRGGGLLLAGHRVAVGALLGQVREAVVDALGGVAHVERVRVDELLGEEAGVRVGAGAHRVAAHVLDAAGDRDVVGAERDRAGDRRDAVVIAPAHMRSIAKPGTDWGSPASSAAVRPRVRPWSPVCVVAAIATSSKRSFGICGLRSISPIIALTTRSSARVPQYMPFSPARPNGVRTPSTKTTSVPRPLCLQRRDLPCNDDNRS